MRHENKDMTQMGTRDLFLSMLTQIGCQSKSDEEGRISFDYQGEHFVADADNEHKYVTIWDYYWLEVTLDDIDEVSRVRKAINETNCECDVSTGFSIDEEDQEMNVHSKSAILFIPQIPELTTYLRTELNEFFHAHYVLKYELERQGERHSR